jgi:hypothetical protein
MSESSQIYARDLVDELDCFRSRLQRISMVTTEDLIFFLASSQWHTKGYDTFVLGYMPGQLPCCMETCCQEYLSS